MFNLLKSFHSTSYEFQLQSFNLHILFPSKIKTYEKLRYHESLVNLPQTRSTFDLRIFRRLWGWKIHTEVWVAWLHVLRSLGETGVGLLSTRIHPFVSWLQTHCNQPPQDLPLGYNTTMWELIDYQCDLFFPLILGKQKTSVDKRTSIYYQNVS